MRKSVPPPRAFSLVELLTVMAIIAVLAVLVQAGVGPTLTAYRISTGTQQVNDALNSARQLAVSQNQYVQVRFLAPRNAPSSPHFTAVATYLASSPFYGASESDYAAWQAEGRFRREGRVRRLPESTAIARSATLSRMIDWMENDAVRPRTGTETVGGVEHDWVGFYFRPDGSVDMEGGVLPPEQTYLTLAPLTALLAAGGTTPSNFASISLDPVTGRTTVTRP